MARSFRGSALWLSPWWDQFQATAEVLRRWRCSGQAVSREAASCPAPPPQTQAQSRESWRLCRGTDLSGSRLPAFLPPLTFLTSSPRLLPLLPQPASPPWSLFPCASNISSSKQAEEARVVDEARDR